MLSPNYLSFFGDNIDFRNVEKWSSCQNTLFSGSVVSIFCLPNLYILLFSCLLTFTYQSYSFLPMMYNFGFFLSNLFKQPLQRLIFPFLIINSYWIICGSACGGLGSNDFPKGTGFCFSTFTKFDNFESCVLLVFKGDDFFFEIFDSLPSFFGLRSF